MGITDLGHLGYLSEHKAVLYIKGLKQAIMDLNPGSDNSYLCAVKFSFDISKMQRYIRTS